MPIDFKLDPITNDIQIARKDVAYTNSIEGLARQRIAITLKAWMGEWFFNTAFGTPYRQSILRKGVTKLEVDSIFISIINSFEEVMEITFYESEHSRTERRFECVFEVRTVEGDATFQVVAATTDGTIYPTPPELIGNLCTAAEVSLSQSSDFYELINIDVPVTYPW